MTDCTIEIEALKQKLLAQAEAAWEARRKAALDALVPPDNPYRIRRVGSEWYCERAEKGVRGHVQDPQGNYVSRIQPDHFSPKARPGNYPRFGYTPEQYDADINITAEIYWIVFGPKGYESVFYSYTDAEVWLRTTLKPEAETVYFSPDGTKKEGHVTDTPSSSP